MGRNITYGSRFSDAPWILQNEDKPFITVGGSGGIGSWLMVFLSRTANYKKIFLYENDWVDATNMAGQCFDTACIGLEKNDAIVSMMYKMSSFVEVQSMGEYKEDLFVTPYTFTCFDNMQARRLMFEKWKSLDNRELFIDGRMLMEDGQIYSVIKGREEKYEKTLFNDNDIKEAACSMKATSHCGAITASLMLSSFNNYIANEFHYKSNIREIPFKIEFNLGIFNIEIKYD